MNEDELRVRASLEDDLSRPLAGVREAVEDVGDEALDTGRKASIAERSLGRLGTGVGKLTGLVRRGLVGALRLAKYGLIALAGAAVFGLGKVLALATDAGETLSKFNTVFGRNRREMERWVQGMHSQFGIATKDLRDAASTFGVFGQAADVAKKELPGFSKSLVQAALDLGSFYNVDPGQVFEDLRSGLAGETEPLRKYGVFLSEANMTAQAATMGLTGELSEQQKVVVRHAFILDNLGKAQGDLARTSDSLSNQWRQLVGRTTELGTTLGQGLIPIATDLVQLGNRELRPMVANLTREVPKLTEKMEGLSTTGKIKLLWSEIVAEPFTEWWRSTGAGWANKAGTLIATTLGKVIRGAILAPLYIFGGSADEVKDAGVQAGVKFWRHFIDALDPVDIIKRLLGSLTSARGLSAAAGLALFTSTGRGLIGKLLLGGARSGGGVPGVAGGIGGLVAGGVGTAAATKAGPGLLSKVGMFAKGHPLATAAILATTAATARWLSEDEKMDKALSRTTRFMERYGFAAARAEGKLEITGTGMNRLVSTGGRLIGKLDLVREHFDKVAGSGKTWYRLIRDGEKLTGREERELAYLTDTIERLGGKLSQNTVETTRNLIQVGYYEGAVKNLRGELALLTENLGNVRAALRLTRAEYSRALDRGVSAQALRADALLGPGGGDTPSSRTRGAGGLARTLGAHARIESLVPGRRRITSAVRGWGRSGDHQAGRALDLIGSNLQSYADQVRRGGGFAEMHGAGAGRHLHAVPAGDTASSRARAAGVSAGDVIVQGPLVVVERLYGADEVEIGRVVKKAIGDVRRDGIEREAVS